METKYYSEPAESYACRKIRKDDRVYKIYGKFYGEEEHERKINPLITKLDANTISSGDEITKEEYKAL